MQAHEDFLWTYRKKEIICVRYHFTPNHMVLLEFSHFLEEQLQCAEVAWAPWIIIAELMGKKGFSGGKYLQLSLSQEN